MVMEEKIYCYVDESGQDTKGELFIVAIVVVGRDRQLLRDYLRNIEKLTNKKRKWSKTSKKVKEEYLTKIISDKTLTSKIFVSISKNLPKASFYQDVVSEAI